MQNSTSGGATINKRKMEEDWEKTRKNFDKEQINERILQDQITQLENYNQQLLLTNDQILNSNQTHQVFIEKLQQNINFYKEYHKKMIKMQNKMKSNKSCIQTQNNQITSSNSMIDFSLSLSKVIKQGGPQSTKTKGSHSIKQSYQFQLGSDSKRQQDQFGADSKIKTKTKLETILNNSVDHINIPTLNDEEDAEPDWNVRECKQFIKNMADDFYSSLSNTQQMILSRKIITKIQQDGGIGFQMQQKRFNKIRSISNVLEYKRDKKNDEFYSNSKKDLSQQFNKHPQINYVHTENDEYIVDVQDVILERFKQQNNLFKNNNNITQSNNNSSTHANTINQQNGLKNLEIFGAHSLNNQNSQSLSNQNLPHIPKSNSHQGEIRNIGQTEKPQPGDISAYLENGVDISYELRSKQNGGDFHQNGNVLQNSQINPMSQRQINSHDLKQSFASKKGQFISTHSPSYIPNSKNHTRGVSVKQNKNQYNNDDQSFMSNDDVLNNQILSSQFDVGSNMNTQQDEKF